MTRINHRWMLAEHPVGLAKPDDFRLVEETVPDLEDGQVLLEVAFVSLDPGQRMILDPANGMSAPGATVSGWGVGKVIESRSARFPVGSHARDVMAQIGVQRFSVISEDNLVPVEPDVPLTWYLGVLGMPGMTAYFGMVDVGRPKAGETVVVSGASGSVGSVAAQIARIQGSRVIGLARGETKRRHLIEAFRLHEAIDGRAEDTAAALARKCPEGVDLFFDTVGGEMLEAALLNMKFGGRIATAGMIATYNRTDEMPGLRHYDRMFTRVLSWRGISVGNYVTGYPDAVSQLKRWIEDGQIVFEEDIASGIEKFPEQFDRLFTARPIGKMILQIA